jgi:hypothetical protein
MSNAFWQVWLGQSTNSNPAGSGADASINSNVLKQSYINKFLDVSGTLTVRYDASINGNLYLGAGTKFGLGIGAPTYTLDMSGTQRLQCPNAGVATTKPDANPGNNGLVLTSTKASGGTNFSMGLGIDYSTGNGYLNMGYNSGGSAAQPFVLQGTGGYVGIGSANPTAALHVVGNQNLTGTITGAGGSTYNAGAFYTGGNTVASFVNAVTINSGVTNAAVVEIGSLNRDILSSAAANVTYKYALAYHTNTTGGDFEIKAIPSGATYTSDGTPVSRMYITASGNIGMGTVRPQYNLDVSGTARFTNDVSINGNLVIGGALTVQQLQSKNVVNTTTTNYQLIVSEDLSLNGRLFVSGDASLNGNIGFGRSYTNNTSILTNYIGLASDFATNQTSTYYAKGLAIQGTNIVQSSYNGPSPVYGGDVAIIGGNAYLGSGNNGDGGATAFGGNVNIVAGGAFLGATVGGAIGATAGAAGTAAVQNQGAINLQTYTITRTGTPATTTYRLNNTMTLKNNSVGIGVTSPGNNGGVDLTGLLSLDISGGTRIIGNSNQFIIAPPSSASNLGSTIRLNGTFYNFPSDTGVRSSAQINSGFSSKANTWGGEYLSFNVGNNGNSNDGVLANCIERMRIDGYGYVGIGTANPQSVLDVSGTIRVSGGITPIYTTPNASAGQVGSVIVTSSNNVTYTITSTNAYYLISTATVIPAGVYIVISTVYCYAQTINYVVSQSAYSTSSTSGQNLFGSGCKGFAGPSNNSVAPSMNYTDFWTTSGGTFYFFFWAGISTTQSGTTMNTGGCNIQFMRIA